MIGTLWSAGSLKIDCLTKMGAQLQSLLSSSGVAFCINLKYASYQSSFIKKKEMAVHSIIRSYITAKKNGFQ
jgi:hypothetical protein